MRPRIQKPSTLKAAINLINESSRLILFGGGQAARTAISRVPKLIRKVDCIVESNPESTTRFGKVVRSPKYISSSYNGAVVIASSFSKEIEESTALRRILRNGVKVISLSYGALVVRSRSNYPTIAEFSSLLRYYERSAILSPQKYQPKLSVVIATYNSEPLYLRYALLSVLNQTYKAHEIIISDDCSTNMRTRLFLDKLPEQFPGVKVIKNKGKAGISNNNNNAINQASGDYIVLLDHDDKLNINALNIVAQSIQRNPDKIFFYSNEDKISPRGYRYGPYHKPQLSRVLLCVQNCISHLSVIRLDIVRSLSGFDSEFDGSQDWKLSSEILTTYGLEAFQHIPQILYHWRALPTSTASNSSVKPYARVAGERLVERIFLQKYRGELTLHADSRNSFNRVGLAKETSFEVLIICESLKIITKASRFTALDTGINMGQCKKIHNNSAVYNFLQELKYDSYFCRSKLIGIMDEAKVDYIMLLESPGQLTKTMLEELICVCKLSRLGLSTAPISSRGKDLRSLLFNESCQNFRSSNTREMPSWIMDVQQETCRGWVNFLMISRDIPEEVGALKVVGKQVNNLSFQLLETEDQRVGFGFSPFTLLKY